MRALSQDVFSSPDTVRPPRLVRPSGPAAPILITSPHSGTDYTEDLLAQTRLPIGRLRASEDSLVDLLLAGTPRLGATLLSAHVPRVFCDLNRAPWELDQAMFVETLPGYCDTASARISQGYGTIARYASAGDNVYAHRLPFAEATRRIETFWHPFHDLLEANLAELRARFGFCLLLDCHSMPRVHADEADIVLGDAHGSSCAAKWLQIVEHTACEAGLRSVRNQPYAGGYITRHYGQPLSGIQALQIEIARPLYLRRGTHLPGPGFERVRLLLERIVSRIIVEARAHA